MTETANQFVKVLASWQADKRLQQRALADLLGCHESLLSHLRTGIRTPTPEFMSRAIATAPEPWKSALKQARLADQEAADVAAAQVVA